MMLAEQSQPTYGDVRSTYVESMFTSRRVSVWLRKRDNPPTGLENVLTNMSSDFCTPHASGSFMKCIIVTAAMNLIRAKLFGLRNSDLAVRNRGNPCVGISEVGVSMILTPIPTGCNSGLCHL
jgi:hypothetical protein